MSFGMKQVSESSILHNRQVKYAYRFTQKNGEMEQRVESSFQCSISVFLTHHTHSSIDYYFHLNTFKLIYLLTNSNKNSKAS